MSIIYIALAVGFVGWWWFREVVKAYCLASLDDKIDKLRAEVEASEARVLEAIKASEQRIKQAIRKRTDEDGDDEYEDEDEEYEDGDSLGNLRNQPRWLSD